MRGRHGPDARRPRRQSGLRRSRRSRLRRGPGEGPAVDRARALGRRDLRQDDLAPSPRAFPRILGRRARGRRHAQRRPAADPAAVRWTNAGRSARADGRRDKDRPGYDIVRETWTPILGAAEFDTKWNRVLHDGLLAGSELARGRSDPHRRALGGARPRSAAAALGAEPRRDPGSLEVVFLPSPALHDGRFANDGWLQELPDPLTKLTWDNPALVSPTTAETLGLANEDVVRLDYARPLARAPGLARPRNGRRRGRADARLRPFARRSGRLGRRVRRVHASAAPRPLASTAGPASPGSGAPTRSRRPRSTAAWRGARSCASRPWPSFSRSRPAGGGARRERACGESAPAPKEGRRPRRLRGGPASLLALEGAPLRSGPPVGDDDRPELVHRLQRLRGRLPEREQHPGRRQGPGREGPRDALDPHRPLLLRRALRQPGGRRSSPCPACTARTRPASRSARWPPPCTTAKAST